MNHVMTGRTQGERVTPGISAAVFPFLNVMDFQFLVSPLIAPTE
jgi:hypothetical protein